jgi:5'-3' exonuclease
MRVGALAELENRHGKPTGGFFASLKSIQGYLATNQADNCYIVFDAGISKRRRAIYPGYKGARYRDESDPLWEPMDEDTEEYLGKFRRQRKLLQIALPRLGVRVLRVNGFEADDVIAATAHYVTRHAERGSNENVHIVSDDKDMLQLAIEQPGVAIHIIRPIAKQHIRDCPTGFLIKKALNGDKSDDIPGIPGVGETTIEKIFQEGAPMVGPHNMDELFMWCMDHKSKRVRKISDNIDIVLRNYELIALHYEDTSSAVPHIEAASSLKPTIDVMALRHMFTELDLYSIIQDFHVWIVPFQRLTRRSGMGPAADTSIEPEHAEH